MVDHDAHDHDHDDHGGMGKYVWVFLALLILTGISFGFGSLIPYMKGAKGVAWAVMMAVSCMKALLVMLFFMHLLWEANWKYVLTIPASIMSLLVVLALVPDVGMRTKHYAEERSRFAAEAVHEEEHSDGEHSDGEHPEGDHPHEGKSGEPGEGGAADEGEPEGDGKESAG